MEGHNEILPECGGYSQRLDVAHRHGAALQKRNEEGVEPPFAPKSAQKEENTASIQYVLTTTHSPHPVFVFLSVYLHLHTSSPVTHYVLICHSLCVHLGP